MSKPFNIRFSGLSLGQHKFNFNITLSDFSDDFKVEDALGLDLALEVVLVKEINLMHLNFSLGGCVLLPCDRCTNKYSQPIHFKEKILVKFSSPLVIDEKDETHYMDQNQIDIDLRPFIYEFICLAIPMKRVHEKTSDCDQESIEFIHKFADSGSGSGKDPRWNILEELN